MKIAVPVTKEDQIDSHFGHCESYGVYTISDKKEITEINSVESPQGCGCKSDIASVFASDGVTVMLAGGIGGGAINVLNYSGIWKRIDPSVLYIPLDLHSGNTARKPGLLTRKMNDWKAVEELTAVLREFDPADPVKYDFALFGLGVFEKF